MESVAESIVSKFGQLVVEELQQIRGVGEKVVHLRDELATMNAVLRMLSESDEALVDHLVREWTKQVRELSYDAQDCIDIYWLRIRSPRHARSKLLPYMVKWPQHQIKKLLLQRALAADIKDLLARTAIVSERRARYGINREAQALRKAAFFAPVPAASLQSAQALPPADDGASHLLDDFITEQANTLADTIKAKNEERDRKLKVFSIVGFGGLGKTSLAMEVCRRLEGEFQLHAQLSVSQAFHGGKDIKGLLLRLLHQIVTDKEVLKKINEMDVEDLANMLSEHLKEKRYLIVIDDIWSIPAWEAIRINLPENDLGSRIIVTTRMETVAKAASVLEKFVHRMTYLDLEVSKKLFEKRVFGPNAKCPNELQDSMDKILKRCGGLPLAIISMASLLASYNSPGSLEMWTRVCKSTSSQMENHPTLEGMAQLITLSYNYLPHHLKACMMYISIFPEDYVVEKYRLLYRWIAEGLVAEKRGLSLIEVAEDYFNELISRNMILPDMVSQRVSYKATVELEACRVHDMMLEVMVSKSLEANFVSLVGRQFSGGASSNGKIRRLSIHDDGEEQEQAPKKDVEQPHGIEAMNLQHVRSLTTFQTEGLKLLDRLGEFKLLRVLDLEDCEGLEDRHMRDICCRLHLLRFLSLRGTDIDVMPPAVGDLEHLQMLNLEETLLEGLPETVTKLKKLERLKMSHQYLHPQNAAWKLPRGLKKMKSLREVSIARLNNDVQVAQEIGELQQLQGLFIVLGMNSGNQVLKQLGSSLSKTHSLRSLHMVQGLREVDERVAMVQVLREVSSPPPLLRYLTVEGDIGRFPDWISSLTHLKEIAVMYARLEGDLLFSAVCKLPGLQRIKLGFEDYNYEELVARTSHEFPVLRSLSVSCADRFPKVVKFEKGSMAKLETLEVHFGQTLGSIVGIENLKSLKEVRLSGWAVEVLEQLKAESNGRPNQFKVVVNYDYY